MVEEKVPRGKKKCPKCSEIVGVRLQICSCGYEFVAKKKTTSKKTGGREISKVDVETIFNVRELMIEAAGQGITVEDFAASTKLTWSDLKDVKTAKELERFKKRERFGVLVEAIGADQVSRIAGFIRETGNGVD